MNMKTKILPLIGLAALALLAVVATFNLQLSTFNLLTSGLALATLPLAMTEEQLREGATLLDDLKGGWKRVKELPDLLKRVEDENAELKLEVGRLKKANLTGASSSGVRWLNGVPFVSDECARALASLYIIAGEQQGKLKEIVQDSSRRERLISVSSDFLGLQTRAALTSSDIPLPTIYVPQVVELVWKYGQFRANSTVFPLGAGTVNLPQLKAGEDAFGIVAASAPVGEKKVAAQNVTFTAQKVGGIIRIPTEIEEDTFIPLGQFLARYIARRFAHFEDMFGFLADGSGTYASRNGVGANATAQSPALVTQLTTGKTKPSDATLADWRNMRALINAAAIASGAYYCHPTMEPLLSGYNTSATVMPYRPATGTQPATLDGFPIRWVGVMQPFKTSAAASAYLAYFGDLSYWYLGERGQPRVETSREVYFATDEIGMRAIERIDIQPMAPDAMSALQTAAS
jgi:HK97 family phage major capsid protein